LAPPLVGGASCQAMAAGVRGPPVVYGPVLRCVEPYRESVAGGLGAHTDICDLVIMIMGQLASFGLPWWRRAGRKLGTA
jgi:hypothetical protein